MSEHDLVELAFKVMGFTLLFSVMTWVMLLVVITKLDNLKDKLK